MNIELLFVILTTINIGFIGGMMVVLISIHSKILDIWIRIRNKL